MQSWLEGRNWVGKYAQATGMTASLRKLSSKADSNTWESFTRSELKLESVHQESPRSDVFRKRATKPLLKQKHRQKHLTWAKEKKNWAVAQWSKVLFSDESKCCISFGNQGPRVWRKSGEAHNPCCLKSSVKFPQSVMIWAAMSSAGVGRLCFLKSTVNAAIYQEILEHFMLPSADKLYGDADYIFQQDLAPTHTAKGTKSWFNGSFSTVGPVRASALKGPGGANSLGSVAPSPKSWCVSTIGPKATQRFTKTRPLHASLDVTQPHNFTNRKLSEISNWN